MSASRLGKQTGFCFGRGDQGSAEIRSRLRLYLATFSSVDAAEDGGLEG